MSSLMFYVSLQLYAMTTFGKRCLKKTKSNLRDQAAAGGKAELKSQ